MTDELNTGRCLVCTEAVPSEELLDHLRVMHPAEYGDGPQRWPDGAVVIVDTTLTPEKFGECL